MPEVYCHIHPLTVMICPRCIAAEGGKTTAKTHSHAQLSRWGKLGGRPKKKKPRSKKRKPRKK